MYTSERHSEKLPGTNHFYGSLRPTAKSSTPSKTPINAFVHFQGMVLAARSDTAAVSAPVYRINLVGVTGQVELDLLCLDVPHLHCAVLAAANQQAPVTAPGHLIHALHMTAKCRDEPETISSVLRHHTRAFRRSRPIVGQSDRTTRTQYIDRQARRQHG